MEFKGTKGEWYKMNAESFGVPFIVASGNETLFQVYGDDAEANAKLISCAPEMFDALIHIEDFVTRSLTLSGHSEKDIDYILRKVRPVIKKATTI